MTTSPNLSLSYLLPQQAQKHVTVNESLRRLDAIAQLAVASSTVAAEPSEPAEGVRYIVPDGASGAAWSGFSANNVAAFQDGAWVEVAPAEGWIAFVADAGEKLIFRSGVWTRVSRLGVNATPDADNRFAVASDAALFAHDAAGTGDVRIKVSKEASGDTASHLFQTAYSGRAEIGLAGDDNFHLKVSPDGSNWKDALVVNNDSGRIGINHPNPGAMVDIRNGGSNAISVAGASAVGASFGRFANTSGAISIYYRKARGSLEAPAIVHDNDKVGGFIFTGYDGVRFQESALFTSRVDGPPSNDSVPIALSFYTGVSTASRSENLTIASDGRVGVGRTSPAVKLDVAGPVRVQSYAVSGLPAAGAGAGQIIFVSDESGGATLAFSDGANWRRVQDRAVVS